MKKIALTEKQVQKIIEQAFKKGQDWAETYSGWFVPDKESTTEKIDIVKKTILKKIKK